MRTQWFLWWRRPARTQTGSAVLLNAGRGGETIRSICKASGAKITCDKESEGTLLLSRLIKISGTQKEVAAAKASADGTESRLRTRRAVHSVLGHPGWPHSSRPFPCSPQHLILEKVSEDEELRKRIAHSAETRVPRKQPISVRREAAAEPGAAGEPASWHSAGARTQQASPPVAPPHRGGGDVAVPGPEEGSWETPNSDSIQKSGAQTSPETSMFESMQLVGGGDPTSYMKIEILAYVTQNRNSKK